MRVEDIKKYAELAVKVGVNIQEGEGLVINTTESSLPLAREASKLAYSLGAKHVQIIFSDDRITLDRYENAKDSVFENFPTHLVNLYENMYTDNYHHLFIRAGNPGLLKDIDPKKVSTDQKSAGNAMQNVMKYRMNGTTKWCIVEYPTVEWARVVFPDLADDEALAKLTENILFATRVDKEDPIAAWKEHDKNLKKYRNFLNEKQYDALKFTGEGTDLTVGLADRHYWMGGSKTSIGGSPFVANIPTEEVFTTPDRNRVNGHVKSTKTLELNGKIVKDFGFTFKDGKVVDFYAGDGEEVIKELLAVDEGASRLGEVALVQNDSPISNTGLVFSNTLFDENASCHLALGRAYAYAMQGGSEASDEELQSRGANFSFIHVDFMIGEKDTKIVGINKDGTEELLFENGNWVI